MPRPATPECSTTGCSLPQGHAGNCNNWQPCPTMGCTKPKNHGGACNANE